MARNAVTRSQRITNSRDTINRSHRSKNERPRAFPPSSNSFVIHFYFSHRRENLENVFCCCCLGAPPRFTNRARKHHRFQSEENKNKNKSKCGTKQDANATETIFNAILFYFYFCVQMNGQMKTDDTIFVGSRRFLDFLEVIITMCFDVCCSTSLRRQIMRAWKIEMPHEANDEK